MPSAFSSAAISRAAAGRMVLMSTATRPGRAPLATPCAPSMTSRTSGASGTIEITTSAALATSAGLAAARAPAASNGCIDASRRDQTVRAWPCFSRFCAIGRPMMPKPTNPTFINALHG